MRMNQWYFQGWEKHKDENGKTDFVYVGEYYTLPQGLKQAKTVSGWLTVGAVALYALVAFLPSAGGLWRFSAPAQLLELIPLIYLCMGVVNLLLKKQERMTYRDWYGSWRRMRWASLWAAIFAGAMGVTQVVYMIGFSGGQAIGRELLHLVGQVLCAGLCVALRLYIQKHPCTQSS